MPCWAHLEISELHRKLLYLDPFRQTIGCFNVNFPGCWSIVSQLRTCIHMNLGNAARKLTVGHNTIREYLASVGPGIEDNLNATLTERQCRKLFLRFMACERNEIEKLFKEFLSDTLPGPRNYGSTETKVSVRAIPTPFEIDRRRH